MYTPTRSEGMSFSLDDMRGTSRSSDYLELFRDGKQILSGARSSHSKFWLRLWLFQPIYFHGAPYFIELVWVVVGPACYMLCLPDVLTRTHFLIREVQYLSVYYPPGQKRAILNRRAIGRIS